MAARFDWPHQIPPLSLSLVFSSAWCSGGTLCLSASQWSVSPSSSSPSPFSSSLSPISHFCSSCLSSVASLLSSLLDLFRFFFPLTSFQNADFFFLPFSPSVFLSLSYMAHLKGRPIDGEATERQRRADGEADSGQATLLRRRRTKDAFQSQGLPAVKLRSHLYNIVRKRTGPSCCILPQCNKILPLVFYRPVMWSRPDPGGFGWQNKAAAGGG